MKNLESLKDKNGNPFVHENLVIDLAGEKYQDRLIHHVEYYYKRKRKIKLSNRYLYTNENGTYIGTDSLVPEFSHYRTVTSSYFLHLITEYSWTEMSFSTAMNLYLIGKDVVAKKRNSNDQWKSIVDFVIADLQSGDYEFDHRVNVKNRAKKLKKLNQSSK